MSTRSFIGKQRNDGSITGIYCHHDGYPEGVGATLKAHYADSAKVNSLLRLGAISSLGTDLDEVVAYHRDRGEDLEPPVVYRDVADVRANASSDMAAEYAYVFVRGEWVTMKLTSA